MSKSRSKTTVEKYVCEFLETGKLTRELEAVVLNAYGVRCSFGDRLYAALMWPLLAMTGRKSEAGCGFGIVEILFVAVIVFIGNTICVYMKIGGRACGLVIAFALSITVFGVLIYVNSGSRKCNRTKRCACRRCEYDLSGLPVMGTVGINGEKFDLGPRLCPAIAQFD